MAEKIFVAQDQREETRDDASAPNATTNLKISKKKSSFPRKIVDACHAVEVDGDRTPQTRIGWLKDPRLYTVCTLNCIRKLFRLCLSTFQYFSLQGIFNDHALPLNFPNLNIIEYLINHDDIKNVSN